MSTPIVLYYPSWHDDARRDKAAGMSHTKIADKYGISQSRVSQIATPNWKAYLVMFRERGTEAGRYLKINDGLKIVSDGKYRFEVRKEPSPAQIEAKRKEERKPVKKMEDEPVARLREFEEIKKFESGKVLGGARITCCKCGRTEDFYKPGGSVNPAYLEKEFTRLGWFVGKNKAMDLCPTDRAKLFGSKDETKKDDNKPVPILVTQKPLSSASVMPAIHAGIQSAQAQPKGLEAVGRKGMDVLGDQRVRVESPTLKEVPMPTVTPAKVDETFVPSFKVTGELPIEPKAEQPSMPTVSDETMKKVLMQDNRPMSRTDDRLIMLKLEDVYVDETTGYKAGWTDAKVAEDLSVPVQWVAVVRDRSFGPEINPEMRKQAQADMIKLGEEVERNILLIDKKMEQMQALDDKLVTLQKEIDASIERYDQLVKNLGTEDKHMESLISSFDGKVEGFKKMFSDIKAKGLA